jgi:hypothetical protein
MTLLLSLTGTQSLDYPIFPALKRWAISANREANTTIFLQEFSNRATTRKSAGLNRGSVMTASFSEQMRAVCLILLVSIFASMPLARAERSGVIGLHDFDRLYEITVTVAPDGKAAVNWKLRKDRT